MKFLLIATALVNIVSSGRLDSNYLSPRAAQNSQNNIIQQRIGGPTQPPAAIIRLTNDNRGDGRYKFDFETENRIIQQEVGEVKNAGTDQESNVIQGSYSYTGPDGVTYTVNYIADEHGFRATGDHIPTAAPIPAEIVDALEQNAAEEAQGIVDDGQYRPHVPQSERKLKKYKYDKH